MAGGAGKQGPDLGLGVPLESLREGVPLAGHLGEESVLLYRRGVEVWAVGGTCTHWSGPLAEGLVAGEEIRCPWHHACFSLRTGEALAPPALNPLPRWRTHVENGRVRLGERLGGDVRSPAVPLASPSSIVIVGAGAAGAAAAETLRREGYAGPVSLVDPDADAPYDRPNLSKDYLAGSAPEEWLQLRDAGFYAEQDIERVVASVVAVDATVRRVRLADGRELPYGALLIATGAFPIRPPIDGVTQPHVHVLRSLADCRRLIEAATHARRVVIAGASFIGLEAAAALRARGLEVCVVAPEPVPFARVFGEALGGMLRALHEEHGVAFRLGRTLARITARDVVLDDGATLPADLVLIGVGVRPLLDVGASAAVADADGVPVDAQLRTRDPAIWAAGDIARYPDALTGERIRIEHWVVAQRQGQAAARSMLGSHASFTAVPFFWTQQHGTSVNYTGHAERWDEVQSEGDVARRSARVTLLRGGSVRAVVTVGRDRDSLEAEVMLESAVARRAGNAGAERDHVG